MNDAESRGDIVDQLAEEFLARYRRGERPAVQEYTDQYPEYAAQIRDLLAQTNGDSSGKHGNAPQHPTPSHGPRADAEAQSGG